MGLIIGPRGCNHKRLEQESGCQIAVRGKGTLKEGKRTDHQTEEEANMPMHVHISADSEERLDKAISLIEPLLDPGHPMHEEFKKAGLEQLAVVNGFQLNKAEMRCNCCGAQGHQAWECPDMQEVNVKRVELQCQICGDKGHPTSDCKYRNGTQPPATITPPFPPTGAPAFPFVPPPPPPREAVDPKQLDQEYNEMMRQIEGKVSDETTKVAPANDSTTKAEIKEKEGPSLAPSSTSTSGIAGTPPPALVTSNTTVTPPNATTSSIQSNPMPINSSNTPISVNNHYNPNFSSWPGPQMMNMNGGMHMGGFPRMPSMLQLPNGVPLMGMNGQLYPSPPPQGIMMGHQNMRPMMAMPIRPGMPNNMQYVQPFPMDQMHMQQIRRLPNSPSGPMAGGYLQQQQPQPQPSVSWNMCPPPVSLQTGETVSSAGKISMNGGSGQNGLVENSLKAEATVGDAFFPPDGSHEEVSMEM
eukprot:Filipodium_phascolosomae@DN5652_c0_g1_i1.p1